MGRMSERVNVHLVDGTYELFRSFFGAPSAKAPDGREVGAVRGLLSSMGALVRDEFTSHVAVAFDTEVESFRNDLFDGYKTGDGMDEELWAQFPLAERAVKALGCVVWPMIEFEADDGLAAGAARYAADERVGRVFICTPDKDLGQMVGGKVVQYDRKQQKLFDEDAIYEKFGVAPESIPDYLALVGDAQDGIPGLPKWGAKSTATVLARKERTAVTGGNPNLKPGLNPEPRPNPKPRPTPNPDSKPDPKTRSAPPSRAACLC